MNRLVCLLLSGFFYVTVQGEDCPYQECFCGGDYILCNDRYLTALPELVLKNSFTSNLNLDGNLITIIPARSLPGSLSLITLQDNPIEVIEDGAFDESINTLQTLVFSRARFTQIPQAVLDLKNMRSFTISDTNILVWNEDAMTRFGVTMETFNLDVVGLTQWPNWIRSFSHLTELSISGSTISSIPDDTLDLVSNTLTSLGLYNNSLTVVPKALSNLTVLRTLSLEQNRITDPTWLPQLSNITTLSLNNNRISDVYKLSTALRAYSGTLETVGIHDNFLTSIPELPFLAHITSLDYTNNHISDPDLGAVPYSLTELKLGNNFLPYIPRLVMYLSIVPKLDLSSNRVKITRETDFPPCVTEVDLSYNLIAELTQTSFPYNSSITSLTLNNNPLSAITIEAFINLPRLTHLVIQHSKLTRLPLAIASLTYLVVIDVSSSPGLVCTCMEKSLETTIKPMRQDNVIGDCGHTSLYIFYTELSQDCPAVTQDVQLKP